MMVGAWELAEIGIKSIMYAATFGAAGGVFFLHQQRDHLADDRRRWIQRLIGGCVVLGILVTAVRLCVLAGSAAGELAGMADRSLLGMIMRGSEGQSGGVRLIGLALISSIMIRTRQVSAPAMTGAVLAATSFVWVGHARGVTPAALAMPLLAIHLVAVAFWLGAFVPLLGILRAPQPLHRVAVLRRFGRSASVAVGLLAAAGIVLLWLLIGSPAQLWSSDYGRMFLVKLILVILLLGLAALNKWRWTPLLEKRNSQSSNWLQRSIIAETVIALSILLVTATFTTLMGPSMAIDAGAGEAHAMRITVAATDPR